MKSKLSHYVKHEVQNVMMSNNILPPIRRCFYPELSLIMCFTHFRRGREGAEESKLTHTCGQILSAIFLVIPGLYIKESGTSKMVTNTFMPNLTMLKYIKR